MNFCLFCKLLQKLCFPPCPRSIIEHVAFQPPSPTYNVYYNKDESRYNFEVDKSLDIHWKCRNTLPKDNIEVTYTTTKSSTKIVCMYYAVIPRTKTTILYSHGNGSDLGTVVNMCVWLANNVQCNVLVYDYSGYGQSTGKASEKHIYSDIEAAFKLLTLRYGCEPQDIILMGQSLGSAPTLDLATRVNVKGVIVQSGFASALNVAFPQKEPRYMCCDMFENIVKANKVTAPVLVIHGTEDDIIHPSHGEAIYKRCTSAVEPLWIEGADHNDIELHRQFLERLIHFIHNELA